MPSNQSYSGQFKRVRQDWTHYDSLPSETKRYLEALPIKCTASLRIIPESLRATIAQKFALSCERLYGPEHPQSATALRARVMQSAKAAIASQEF